ncbi:MAG: diguanylate cyclase [Candidatus Rokubacteria bacterium]|nr:diguanylate cyclase [Candidatus Rokubacteria bacterium]
MYIKFWGTRGSIAAPGWNTAKFGGNTSCIEVRSPGGTLIVLDCGTGARELGMHLMRSAPKPLRLHLFIGHTHWDHIQGFPFFAPAFMPGAEVNIYAPLGFQKSLGEAMAGQMEYAYFPVKLKDLRSRIHFTELDEGFFRVGDVLVETQYLNHTAPTIAYRLSNGNATLVYVTDHEPFWKPSGRFEHPGDHRHIAFLKGADLVIHDAQYTDEEYKTRFGWGHSSIRYATDVALAAGAARLALFHHDPTHDDETMEALQVDARKHALERGGRLDVFAAMEGLELEVKGGGEAASALATSAIRRVPIVGCRVALVNADEGEISSIERELAEDSLVLLSMPDAKTAVTRVKEIAPDIAIVSQQLPDADGAQLVARLREAARQPELPVLVLTDEVEGELRWDGDAPTDYLARPFSPPMLRARVRAWLARTLTGGDERRTLDEREAAIPAGGLHDDEPGDKYIGTLAAMPLFRPLTREQLTALARGGIDQLYPPGHVIVREGTPGDSLFVILSGRVRVTETSRETQAELVLSELGTGEIFGELGVLRNQPRTASVVAIERSHILMLPPANFLRAVERVPGLALGLLKVLAARLGDADRKLARYAPDPLTGLMSRRALIEQYRRVAAGARRRRTGALLILLDVLELRRINDRYGYAFGDEVLKTVADAILEATRTTDLVARVGGDEFAVLLVDVVPKDVQCVVDRVRSKIEEAKRRRELPEPLALSLGVAFASTPPDVPDDLFRDADTDMQRRRLPV